MNSMSLLKTAQLKRIENMIQEEFKIFVFSKKEYLQYNPTSLQENEGWNSCFFINNIIIDTKRVRSNGNKLYYILHELAHSQLHCSNNDTLRYGMEYICINEIEAESVARGVMHNLNIKYTPSVIEIHDKNKQEDLKDKLVDDKIDYMDYYYYEMNEGIFKNKQINRELRYVLVDKYIDLFTKMIQKLL